MELVEHTIAGRLREAMQGRSVRSVAKKAGIEPATVRGLREGRKRGGTVDTLEALAKALGVSAGWLAFGEGAARPRTPEIVRVEEDVEPLADLTEEAERVHAG